MKRLVAFLDLYPVNRGHTLVVPRAHYRNIFDCPPEVAARILATAARLAGPLRAATEAEGMNLWMANEPVAGQTVLHIHLHMLPRYTGDGFGLRMPPRYPLRLPQEERDALAERIKQEIAHRGP